MSVRVLVGTSGYSYPEWKGKFYPEKFAAKGMLAFYAARFPTVEINNTFYRMPTESVMRGWGEQVPEGFSFAVKASKRITHDRRLRDCTDSVEYMVRTASVLGPKLGPLLFQLPPNFKKDLPRLTEFLATLPDGPRYAFEFRHASWFEDDVFQALRTCKVALCVADTGEEPVAPLVATAGWGYLRLRREDFGDDELRAWAERLLAQPWSDAHVFLKHEEEGRGPVLAAKLIDLCREMA
jgi:uncharacterized protein YecE (DUF72 family)